MLSIVHIFIICTSYFPWYKLTITSFIKTQPWVALSRYFAWIIILKNTLKYGTKITPPRISRSTNYYGRTGHHMQCCYISSDVSKARTWRSPSFLRLCLFQRFSFGRLLLLLVGVERTNGVITFPTRLLTIAMTKMYSSCNSMRKKNKNIINRQVI